MTTSKFNQVNSDINNIESGNVNSAQHYQRCIALKHGETVSYEPKMKMISNILKNVMKNLPFRLNSIVMKILPDVNAYPKSQCVLMPPSLETNLLHIVGHQLNDQTSQHLVVTSKPVPTQLLAEAKSCPQLCTVLTTLNQQCECVAQQSSVATYDSLHNHIRFGITSNLQMYTVNNVKGVKYVTTINGNVGFETMQLFSGQINEKSDNLKLLLPPPHFNMIEQPLSSMSSQYILANKLSKNTIVTVKMQNNENEATHQYMSQRIEMIAEPLMSEDRMQQKLTQTCFIGYLPGEKHSFTDACSLELDKSFDYALKIKNIGAQSAHVSVSTDTKTGFAGTVFRDPKIVEIHGNSMNSLHSHHSHGHHSHHHFHHHPHHHAFVFIVIALGVVAFGGACLIMFNLLKDMAKIANNADNNGYARKELQSDEYCSEIEMPEENQDALIYCPPTLSPTNNNAGEAMNNSDERSTEIEITTSLPESNQEILIR